MKSLILQIQMMKTQILQIQIMMTALLKPINLQIQMTMNTKKIAQESSLQL